MPPRGVSGLLAKLAGEFSRSELIASGVAVDSAGTLVLADVLGQESKAIVALRDSPSAPPFDLLASAGLLVDNSLPAIGMLRDYRLLQRTQAEAGCIYVVFSLEDLLVMRVLELPVTLASGLSHTNVHQWWLLQSAYHWKSIGDQDNNACDTDRAVGTQPSTTNMVSPQTEPAESRDDAAAALPPDANPAVGRGGTENCPPIELIFAAWSPGQLAEETPRLCTRVAKHFLDLARHLNADVSNLAAWRPTAHELERIRFCLGVGDVSAAAAAMRKSASDSVFALDVTLGAAIMADSNDYWTLLRRFETLQSARPEAFDPAALEIARSRFHATSDARLVAPLFERAWKEPDPLKRNRLMALGHLARILNRTAPVLGDGVAVELRDLERYAKAVDQFNKLCKELEE